MKRNIFLSSLLLIFSFPNFNFDFLVFVAFVPLFFAIQNKSPKKAFLISYVCGFLFYIGTLYWLYHVTVLGLVVLCLYLALYFGVFGLFFSRFTLLLIPLIWTILEYIQSHIFTGFGWALLGYSQYKNLPLIQIADFSGVYGVSFVIMMVNATAWILIKAVAETRNQKPEHREKNASSFVHRPSFVVIQLLSVLLVLTFVYSYGYFRLNEKIKQSDTVKVSVIQGNIPQELKWDPVSAVAILDKYRLLTRKASRERPDLIIWPETAFPGYLVTDKKLTRKVINLVREIKIPLLLGANTEEDLKSFNSAVLISERGKIIDKYDKIHLVPFGEYVPFSDRLPVLHNLVLGELGEFTAGSDFKVFKLQSKFSTLICYEDIFPELARKFVQNGAEFLVVITNDAWYGKTGAPYQHAACSVFRAIENRVPIVRCANTGYSCFVDKRGKIYDSVEKNRTHLFITGHRTSDIAY